jgi:hypothetical protein
LFSQNRNCFGNHICQLFFFSSQADLLN